jgi:ABC-type uncharacterized transport system permease subunit
LYIEILANNFGSVKRQTLTFGQKIGQGIAKRGGSLTIEYKPFSKVNGYGCVVILLKAVRIDPNSLRVLIRFPAFYKSIIS